MLYAQYVKLRDANHMTDYYVAKQTRLARANFTLWKAGKCKPSRSSLERLSRFFNVPINYFYE
ncbi:MAG: helix-turn-helix transcriptional regulator [Alphaproteobacteria bacterium]|nr:helix-turn-helix transcriptional regulator [Alphaproteobacteria bacterium]